MAYQQICLNGVLYNLVPVNQSASATQGTVPLGAQNAKAGYDDLPPAARTLARELWNEHSYLQEFTQLAIEAYNNEIDKIEKMSGKPLEGVKRIVPGTDEQGFMNAAVAMVFGFIGRSIDWVQSSSYRG